MYTARALGINKEQIKPMFPIWKFCCCTSFNNTVFFPLISVHIFALLSTLNFKRHDKNNKDSTYGQIHYPHYVRSYSFSVSVSSSMPNPHNNLINNFVNFINYSRCCYSSSSESIVPGQFHVSSTCRHLGMKILLNFGYILLGIYKSNL